MHASEVAIVKRKQAWNGDLGIPAISPGTLAEAEAIEAIDRARATETAQHARKGKRAVVRIA